MLSKLIDTWSCKVSGNTFNLRYKEILSLFELKHPFVNVQSYDENTVPGAFLVWRSIGGEYRVELGKSKERLISVAQRIFPKYCDLLDQPWGLRTSKLASELFRNGEHDVLLNWGRFSYECKHGIGEFAATGYGISVEFIDHFVLKEDQRELYKQTVKLK